jgi:hypothetical protein
MAKYRLVLIGVLSTLALSAVTATAAYAEPLSTCESLGTTLTLTQICLLTLSGTLLVLGLPGLETLNILGKQIGAVHEWVTTIAGGEKLANECNNATVSGLVDGTPLASASLLSLQVKYTECTIKTPANCIVLSAAGIEGEILTELLVGTIGAENGDLTLLPASGTLITAYKIDSVIGKTCAVANNKLELLSEGVGPLGLILKPEEDLETHALVFEKAGNLLTDLGEESNPTEITATFELKLDRPPEWNTSVWDELIPWSLVLTEKIS